MPKIEAVLFDLGNTLMYFDGRWAEVLAEARQAALMTFRQAGFQVEMEPFLNVFRETLENNYARREDDLIERSTESLLKEVLGELGYVDLPAHLIAAARRAFYDVTQSHWLPEPDAVNVLQALDEAGYRLGVLSNAADDWDVQTLVDKAKVRPFLDFVLTSAAFGQRKPAQAIFKAALAHWALAPEKVAMVGDTLNADILGANQMGMLSVWITRRVPLLEQRKGKLIVPDAEIKTLNEIFEILDQVAR